MKIEHPDPTIETLVDQQTLNELQIKKHKWEIDIRNILIQDLKEKLSTYEHEQAKDVADYIKLYHSHYLDAWIRWWFSESSFDGWLVTLDTVSKESIYNILLSWDSNKINRILSDLSFNT